MQARQPPGSSTAAPAPTLEHAMMAARARVLSRPGTDVLRQWLAEPQGTGFAALAPARQAGALYAAALAASQLHEAGAARALLPRLQALAQGDAAAQRQARLLAAEVELAAGDAAPRCGLLAPRRKDRPELLLRAQALLHSPGAQPARPTWRRSCRPGWPRTRAMPAPGRRWPACGRRRARGCAPCAPRPRRTRRATTTRPRWTVSRPAQDLARKSSAAGDLVEASIIDTRLRAVESLLREQAAER